MNLIQNTLSDSATKFPEKPAVIYEEHRFTYRELDALTTDFAGHLADMGVETGDRVVIFMDNIPEVVIALYAILKAGGVFVIVSGALKAAKLRYIIEDTACKILISQPYKSGIVNDALKASHIKPKFIWTEDEKNKLQVLKDIKDYFSIDKTNVDSKRPMVDRVKPIHTADSELAALIYTSGSTGEPKGIMSTHQNMIGAARSIISYLKNTSDDVIINVLPLSFDYGLYQVLMTIMFGGTLILEKTFMYPAKILQKMETFKVTGFPLVPTLLAMILKNNSLHRYDLSSLRYITSTGAMLPENHIRQLRKNVPEADIYSMYGLTECKRVSYLPPDWIDTKPGSVGVPIPGCEVRLVDERGRPVETGQTGELIIRGDNVMQGYWNDPVLTDKTFRKDPISKEIWLWSGDLFRQDEEGLLYFINRKDDLIKTKGERVSPREIENIIAQNPDVEEVAVIGIPDDLLGMAIKAFVVLKDSIFSTSNDIQKFCAEHLEVNMVPRFIKFIKKMPRTPNGKIDKASLV